jgi:hypothetical protein
MRDVRPRDVLVKRVNFIWYPLLLLPLLALFAAAASGYLPYWFALIAVFGLVFWLFSLLFALYSLFRRPPNREPRQ